MREGESEVTGRVREGESEVTGKEGEIEVREGG